MPASAFSAAVQSLPSATNIKTMHRMITEMRLVQRPRPGEPRRQRRRTRHATFRAG
jgi:hypothetical protein